MTVIVSSNRWGLILYCADCKAQLDSDLYVEGVARRFTHPPKRKGTWLRSAVPDCKYAGTVCLPPTMQVQVESVLRGEE